MGRLQLFLNPDLGCTVPADRCIWTLRCPAWDLFASLSAQFGTDCGSLGLPETYWKPHFQNPSSLSVHSRPEALGTCSTIPVAFPHLEQGIVGQRILSRAACFTRSKWTVNHFSTHEAGQMAFHLLHKTPRDLPARNATASEPLLLTFSMSKYYFIPVLQPSRHGSQQKRGYRTATAAQGGRGAAGWGRLAAPVSQTSFFAAPKVCAPCVWLGPA